ncbi:hypothetical protein P153DRAFT_402886 [Dothidotthia symphoricarpi CBS 119687]|uniref:Uncharacterized protein n=1 Tax=Dothidotthia symphoricarpi CBS 119687 TaxID=1392245 RepID=A0A6A6AC82_9PLEO|nr:uncharacterized protein P153DRAFT_402886 [Dothidotthia symphoricarpi CBS 119687]KAF2129196.1 hypothetical protein P153DRAFT_402886 [Dothidotthia symphoricarpi CBS 119687]
MSNLEAGLDAKIVLQEQPTKIATRDASIDVPSDVIQIGSCLVEIYSGVPREDRQGRKAVDCAFVVTNPLFQPTTSVRMMQAWWYPDTLPVCDGHLWALPLHSGYKYSRVSGWQFHTVGLVIVAAQERQGFWKRVGAYFRDESYFYDRMSRKYHPYKDEFNTDASTTGESVTSESGSDHEPRGRDLYEEGLTLDELMDPERLVRKKFGLPYSTRRKQESDPRKDESLEDEIGSEELNAGTSENESNFEELASEDKPKFESDTKDVEAEVMFPYKPRHESGTDNSNADDSDTNSGIMLRLYQGRKHWMKKRLRRRRCLIRLAYQFPQNHGYATCYWINGSLVILNALAQALPQLLNSIDYAAISLQVA